MGILLLIITGLIYGLVGTVILHFINNIFALFGEPTILEQPFILDFLQKYNLPTHSFAVSCTWVALFFLVAIILFQLPPVQGLFLKFKAISKPEGDFKNYLDACWQDVCNRAGVDAGRYRLYVQHSNQINAFALGHDRVVVLMGLINEMNSAELKGILAHELSHLIHRDTTYGMTSVAMLNVYNAIIIAFELIVWMITMVYNILRYIPFINILAVIFMAFILFIRFIVRILHSIANFGYMLLAPFGSRVAEYRADRFAHELGLGQELASALAKLTRYGDTEGFINQLVSDHPPLRKRVAKLYELSQQQ